MTEFWLLSGLLLAAGALGGFLAGLLGVGGGIIFVFVLTQYFQNAGVSDFELTRFVISNSIFCTFFAGLASTYKNIRLKAFYPREIALTGFIGAITALLTTYFITRSDWYNKKAFVTLFLFLVCFFIYRLFKKTNIEDQKPDISASSSYLITGFLAGIISSLSGLGGGVLMIPFLNQRYCVNMKKASSISLGVIPIFSLAMMLYYFNSGSDSVLPYTVGYIDLRASIPLVIGVLSMAPLGVATSKKLSDRVIKIMFATILVIVALKMILSILI